jgi:DNA-binding response OmpR family regulator
MPEKKILIVDYDPKCLQALSSLFEHLGFQVIKAIDGKAAYEKFKSEKPDLIVLEAMLPKLHGFDLTQKIYQETKGSVPVIIVTGLYKGTQYRNEAIRTFGAADYFEKPYDDDKLVNSVRNLLKAEVEVGEDLPDPDSVLSSLSKLMDD